MRYNAKEGEYSDYLKAELMLDSTDEDDSEEAFNCCSHRIGDTIVQVASEERVREIPENS